MSVNSLNQVNDSDSIQRKKQKMEKKKLLMLLKQDIFLQMIIKKMDWDWHNYFFIFIMKIMTERSGSTYFSTCILLLIVLM